MVSSIRSKLPPEENALPSPRTRTTLAAGSRSITGQMSARSRCICGPTEFSPGASRTRCRMPSSPCSQRRLGNSSYDISGVLDIDVMLRTCRSAPVAALRAVNTSARRRRELDQSPYLAAVSGRKPGRVPVWFMRQAGRSLPEYRALRVQHSMLAACFEPELACEITLQPIRRYDVDAAILFSDIVVPLRAAGVDLDIVADVGPVIAHPVRTDADIDAMKPLDPQAIQPVRE